MDGLIRDWGGATTLPPFTSRIVDRVIGDPANARAVSAFRGAGFVERGVYPGYDGDTMLYMATERQRSNFTLSTIDDIVFCTPLRWPMASSTVSILAVVSAASPAIMS